MELRHRHVGGGLLWRAAILGHEQPGCKSAQESHEKTYIYSLKAHGRSFMSKFRAGWEFLQAAVALISSVTCWTRACSAVFISSLQMLVAAACLCSSFYHLIYGPGLPTPLQIHTAKPPSSHLQRHTQDWLFLSFFFTCVGTCRLSALHRHCNCSSELEGKKK